MNVRQVMTINVCVVRPDAPLTEIARIMRERDIGAVPVAESDRLVGIVTDRDIVVRGLAKGSVPFDKLTARSVMSGRIYYCFDDQSIEAVLENMGDMQVRRMPVVDRDKRLVGMVSIGDLTAGAPAERAGESLIQISSPTHQ